jgi:hypothetical protein
VSDKSELYGRYPMRFVTAIVLALLLIFSLHLLGMERDPFLADLARVERPAGKDRANVDDVVTQYIPPGTALQDAFRYLEERGFKVYPYAGKDVPLGQKWYTAVKEQRYRVVFAEKMRMIIESDGNQVLRSRGWIFLVGV